MEDESAIQIVVHSKSQLRVLKLTNARLELSIPKNLRLIDG